MERRKPKLLIIGHARHGKDTVANMIADLMGLTFVSSSEFVGRRCIWPMWGEERYCSFDEMFEDRVNFRAVWHNLISAYNTPDKSRTATEMLKEHSIYVGMRAIDELEACNEINLFDHIIWVEAGERHPPEGKDSNKMTSDLADIYIENNGPEENLLLAINNLQKRLHEEGYEVNYVPDDAAEFAEEQLQKNYNKIDDEPRTIINRPMDDNYEAVPLDPKFTAVEDSSLSVGNIAGIDKKYKPLETEIKELRTWMDAPYGAIKVLDHGFLQVKEVMGSDETILGSARMSYGRGTKKTSPDDTLMNYLIRNGHTSPLEMGEIRFHIRMPIFVMRQWVRHRTANLNEYSGRYSEMVRLWYTPELDQICLQDKVNKQGSAEPMSPENAEKVQRGIWETSNQAFNAYEEMLAWGVSRETARIVLPLNTYTEVVWKLDISNLLKFLTLRDDDHAQWEIRQYAIHVAQAVKENFPLVYNAYLERRQSQTLTMDEIRALVTGNPDNLSVSQKQKMVMTRYNIFN